MPTDDSTTPASRVSRVEDRDRLLAETLAHADSKEAHYKVVPPPPPPPGRWKAPVAWGLLALAAGLTLFPPAWIQGKDAAGPTAADMDRGVRAALYLQAQQVEAFRVRVGRLPNDLSELPSPLPDMTFVRSGSRVYQLRAPGPDGEMVIYDSSLPAPEFQDAAGWIVRSAP